MLNKPQPALCASIWPAPLLTHSHLLPTHYGLRLVDCAPCLGLPKRTRGTPCRPKRNHPRLHCDLRNLIRGGAVAESGGDINKPSVTEPEPGAAAKSGGGAAEKFAGGPFWTSLR